VKKLLTLRKYMLCFQYVCRIRRTYMNSIPPSGLLGSFTIILLCLDIKAAFRLFLNA
jgi:hypothetical protein